MNPEVRRVLTIDSTSLALRAAAERGERGPVVLVAAEQTGGVGQRGRAWASPPGGLWLSLAWPWDARPIPTDLGIRIGWAVLGSVEAAVGDLGNRLRLKWPNDLLIDGRKAAGILTEVVGAGDRRAVIVGVGINANTPADQYPEELRRAIITLREATGREVDLPGLEARVVRALVGTLSGERPMATLAEIQRRLYGVGGLVTLTLADGRRSEVEVVGLGEGGVLRVRRDGAEFSVASGVVLG